MGRLEDFSIHFTNDDGVFHSGGELQGFVTLILNQSIETTGLTLRLKGECNVSFKLPGEDGYTDCQDRETYFEDTIVLVKPDNGETKTVLNQGIHRYDFSYVLLPSLPTSFEGEYGSVRYSARCTVENPGAVEYDVTVLFSVICALDLNLEKTAEDKPQTRWKRDDKAMERFHGDANREDGCCFCYDNGEVTISMDLPRLGYVPGDNIPVTAEIHNRTSGFVRTSVHFIQTATYRCHTSDKPKISKEVVGDISDLELEPHSKFVHGREKIRVPALPPSRLDGCSLIDLAYSVKLKALTDFSGVSCKVVAAIIIGTVPLRSQFTRQSNSGLPLSTVAPLATSEGENPTSEATFNASDFPPPVFERSISGMTVENDADDIPEASTSFSYVPKYAVYKY